MSELKFNVELSIWFRFLLYSTFCILHFTYEINFSITINCSGLPYDHYLSMQLILVPILSIYSIFFKWFKNLNIDLKYSVHGHMVNFGDLPSFSQTLPHFVMTNHDHGNPTLINTQTNKIFTWTFQDMTTWFTWNI